MRASSPLLATYVHQFLADRAGDGRSHRTIASYRERLAPFLQFAATQPPDVRLDRAFLKRYRTHLQTTTTLRPVTIAGRMRAVSVFCRWLLLEDVLDRDIAARVIPTTPKYVPPIYERDQLARLLDVCDRRDRAILTLFLETGMRAAELVALDRTDVLPSGRLRIFGKGQRERTQELLPLSRAFLRAYLRSRTDPDPALFVGRKGRLGYSGVYQVLKRRAEQAGIRGQVQRLVHALRATFAVEYLLNGGDIEDLRRLLGHRSRAMSEHYAQVALDRLASQRKRQVDPLAAMFGRDTLQAYLNDEPLLKRSGVDALNDDQP